MRSGPAFDCEGVRNAPEKPIKPTPDDFPPHIDSGEAH